MRLPITRGCPRKTLSSFIPRALGEAWRHASASFPVLLLTGPRQVGKTTLLRHLATPDRRYVTLDDLALRGLARRDPALFLDRFAPPVLIDEVQYAPELLSGIKLLVDRDRSPGAFWLTGSQQFHLMQGVSESLAGRIVVASLLGLSQREEQRADLYISPFVPAPEVLATRAGPGDGSEAVFARVWRGGMPGLLAIPDALRDVALSSFVQTYLERDVRSLVNVGSLLQFERFLRAVAVRTGQLLNYADLAREVDISPGTARTWLSVLEASALVLLVPPWSGNATSRIVKTPKLHFLDTGLAAWLGAWPDPETLRRGAQGGAMFESWVVGEILKSWWNRLARPALYFYRDHDGREIDLVIERAGRLHPVEVKVTATPRPEDIRHFRALDATGRRGAGALVCLVQEPVPLTATDVATPASAL